jgi:hypothetical protein
MGTEFLSNHDKQRLWVFERVAPFVLAVVLPVAIVVALWSRNSEERKRQELIAKLNALPHTYSVRVGSRAASDPVAVVEALKTIGRLQSHHSSPTEPRLIEVMGEKTLLRICLERDSERATEYWVSDPRGEKYGGSSFGQPYFGGLHASSLSAYWPDR